MTGSGDVDRWILPGDLARALGPGEAGLLSSRSPRSRPARADGGGGRRRGSPRTVRDWVVDSIVFVVCAAVWLAEALGWSDPVGIPEWLRPIDLVTGAGMVLATWWRREHPVAVGIAAAVVGAISTSASIALLVGFFSLALHRGWRWGYGVAVVAQVLALPHLLTYRPGEVGGSGEWIVIVTLVVGLATTAGLMVRARRQLVRVLEQRARDAQREQHRRVADAQEAERARIAREMHDVLAHRLSLLSVHAGALEYRLQQAPAGSVPPEVAASVSVVRENAHLSLEELRDVLHVLRASAVTGEGVRSSRPRCPTTAAPLPPRPSPRCRRSSVRRARPGRSSGSTSRGRSSCRCRSRRSGPPTGWCRRG
ncbi:sensor histidine kinase [Litorihabitans aurantiacus]|uniref:histidine kinase n=1 Tax=Litorihabitans aurantiacus TaxID=1930061 RepID=A0AA37XG57_9MICO|nr:histidine kinase dimerization/phosphoacceptor domain-containing protein [Litorihabitans aurantiacus]GMA32655.1 hypothetical protein GCM10025875_26470 [Litorihabitans aurantiacus]